MLEQQMSRGKIIGIVSVKGGVGKTTVAINLSAALARDCKKQVVLVDSNFSTPHVALSLGVMQPTNHIHAVLNDSVSVFDAVYYHPLGFYVLPGSLAPTAVDATRLKEKISELKNYFDYVVLDTSPSLHDELYAAISASDELYAVSSPDVPTMSSTIHSVAIAKERGVPIRGIIVNKARNKSWEMSTKEITQCTGVPVVAILKDDAIVPEAAANNIPLPFYDASHHLSRRYRALAQHVSGMPAQRSLFSFAKTFFSSRTVKGGTAA
jgi:MinD-like ATPase involved in chromosome partitioning or flagellar assembly